ncbi:MAG: 30S ribosomal protein S7 [Christensenellaceae bacterium]|nr:30S ribosomal protein S7 [Christensenellaceae bacterium]
MPRRGFIPKREVLPDPMYGSVIVTKLINQVMYDGKRGVAQRVCYEAFDLVAQRSGKEAGEVFETALNNIMPVLEVKARRVGGATYQVPIEIRPERRQTLALRWLVEFSRGRGEKTMAQRLGNEILDASNNTGAAVRRKEEMHRMAEANKAFAHYRW